MIICIAYCYKIFENTCNSKALGYRACLLEQLAGKLFVVPLGGGASMVREHNIIYRNSYRHPEVADELRKIYLRLKKDSYGTQ